MKFNMENLEELLREALAGAGGGLGADGSSADDDEVSISKSRSSSGTSSSSSSSGSSSSSRSTQPLSLRGSVTNFVGDPTGASPSLDTVRWRKDFRLPPGSSLAQDVWIGEQSRRVRTPDNQTRDAVIITPGGTVFVANTSEINNADAWQEITQSGGSEHLTVQYATLEAAAQTLSESVTSRWQVLSGLQ